MRELISAAVGAGLAAVIGFGGVATYTAVSTEDTQQANPETIGYADE